MTNNTPGTEFVSVLIEKSISWPSVFAWLSVLALILWTIGIVFWWTCRREVTRDPSVVVGACIVQFAVFLLLETNGGLRSMFGYIHLGVPDAGMLFLFSAQLLYGKLITCLVGLTCAIVACLISRRLPKIPWITVAPVLIAAADSLLSLLWLVWMCTLKK